MQDIAILGPTASGKTSLSIELAKQLNANILSLDSLSIYKEIDIASAKPTLQERGNIKHFGIDALSINESFNVTTFFELYKEAKKQSSQENKNLIIVGGTGFYLKSMIDGVSYKPPLSEETKQKVSKNLANGYEIINQIDKKYANAISKSDSYRIEKWLEIYFQTNTIPSEFFKQNEKEPIVKDIKLYEIVIDKEILRDRISLRTQIMIDTGLIDEVFYLEKKYTRSPNPMKAIGIKECLGFLDGKMNKDELKEKIIINTARLAKRQRTFNSTQFKEHFKGSVHDIREAILKQF
ncbi:tRNA (adenosine(37)-N6)-dimethylallyltransferase MiaA [Sulfurospirillum arcachonense]|uniref:tRNA (adenosine(37)-N6)-dimethylallyltransferase MiaA n=1 Tax=Sulfurospirillum arcachonense TaxID=57666 RepID=UPI00046A93B1|nr:tRNA (adenosine(37)-N6)-dimethylallyltransferase MiaA [Sulfurospirillum arcachonense]